MADINDQTTGDLTDALSGEAKDTPSLAASLAGAPLRLPKPTVGAAYDTAKKTYQQALKPQTPAEVAAQQQSHLDRENTIIAGLKETAAKDPRYQQFSSTLDDAQKMIQQTQGMVADRRATGDWLSAIEKIGHSLTKFAAAKYGLEKGIDVVSGMKLDPTDWQKVMSGSIQDLQDQLAVLHGEKKQAIAGQQGVMDETLKRGLDQQQLEEQQAFRTKERQQAGAQDIAKLGVSAAEAHDREALMAAKIEQQNRAAELRAAQQHGVSPDDKMLKEQKATDQKIIGLELKALPKKLDALNKLQGLIQSQGTMSKTRDVEQQRRQITEQLVQAGVDPTLVEHEVGFFWNKRQEVDPKRAVEVIGQLKQQVEARRGQLTAYYHSLPKMVDVIQLEEAAQKLGLRSTPTAPAAPAAPAPTAAPAAAGKVRVRSKEGKEFLLPADQLEAAKKQGYVEVTK